MVSEKQAVDEIIAEEETIIVTPCKIQCPNCGFGIASLRGIARIEYPETGVTIDRVYCTCTQCAEEYYIQFEVNNGE